METIDALDLSRSEVKRYSDGGVMSVIRYSFKPGMLETNHIFKLSIASGGDLIVDDIFRGMVERNGLTGLNFKPLPTAD